MQDENLLMEAAQEPVALDSQTDSQAEAVASIQVEDTSEDTAGFDPAALAQEAEDASAQANDDVEDIVEPDPPLPDFSFDQASDAMKEAVARQGWTAPMLVQRKAIPYLLAGQDLITQSRTGSGKTGAFAIPLVEVCEVSHAEPRP